MHEPLALLGAAVVVTVTVPNVAQDGGLGSIRAILAQLPEAHTLAPGTMVAMADRVEPRKATVFSRLTGRGGEASLHRAARCTALLARGYLRVGGGTAADKVDWAWGFAP